MLQGVKEGFIVALGENINRLRRDKHWTQGELAEKSGIKVGHISKLERNESDPKLETLYKLMNALECSPNALLTDVKSTKLDGLIEMAMERIQGLPEREKSVILEIVDKYCIAISMQNMVERKTLFGLSVFKGKTEELTEEDYRKIK